MQKIKLATTNSQPRSSAGAGTLNFSPYQPSAAERVAALFRKRSAQASRIIRPTKSSRTSGSGDVLIL